MSIYEQPIRFNDSVHLLVQANNIFAQHYNLYYGMPAQRFNIMQE